MLPPSYKNNRPGAEGKVGHWSFILKRDPSNENEVWTFQCTLCGYKTVVLPAKTRHLS